MCYRALAGVALAFSLAATGTAAPPANANQKGHAHHLLKAEADLVAAEAAITAKNLSQAQKDVASAVKEIQAAIAHHHKHHIAPGGSSGLTGSVHKVRHHHHHSTLQQAEKELLAAEKALQAGNGSQAAKEIEIAAKTIKNAVASHHHLFGKQ